MALWKLRRHAGDLRAIAAIALSNRGSIATGEFVSSHAYSHRERGEARCLSRLHLRTSTIATVTCYLPVQYPVREPVMIESELSENVSATSNEASLAAVQRAEDLLFAGIKEWSLQFPASSGGSTK